MSEDRRSLGEHSKALGMEVDVSKAIKKDEPDLVIKLPRPRDYSPVPDEGASEYVAASGSPTSDVDLNKAYEQSVIDSNLLETLASENIEEAIETVDWGDFDIERLVDLLYKVSELLTGITLMPYQLPIQKRIFRSILINDGATITGLISRQAGKSEAIACSAVTLCVVIPALAKQFPAQLGVYSDGFFIGVYAPSGEQAHTLYSRILKRAQSDNAGLVYDDPDINTGLEKYGCKWTNGSFVFHQSASPQASVESKTYHLICLDESQGLTDFVISKSLEPMLSWTNGSLVMIGTTSEEPCHFYDIILKNRADDPGLPPELQRHFEYDYEEVQKHNPRYKKYVQQQIDKYGIHSRSFQMSYALRWFFEDGLAITDRDLKDFTMHVPVGLTRYSSGGVVVGIDLARKTNSSVVTVGQLLNTELIWSDDRNKEPERITSVKVCDWFEIDKVPYPDQRAMMKAFLEPYTDIRWITVDGTGVGDPIFAEMVADWSFTRNMEPFIFSAKSKNYLMNLFYEYYYKQRIIVPSTDEARRTRRWQNFYLQMISLEKVTASGYTFFQKGHRDGNRDDYADSLFLMLHAAKMASSRHGNIESTGDPNLFAGTKVAIRPGFEGIRQAVRDGTYVKRSRPGISLRKKRADKLLKGALR